MPEPSAPVLLQFGVFEVDLRAGELRKHGVRVRLQEQPFQILTMLLERPGETVTREELRSRLWAAETFVDFDHGVNKAVNRIRDVLGDSASSPRFVETVARRGYRFIADVAVAEGVLSARREIASGEGGSRQDERALSVAAPPSSRPLRRWYPWTITAVALALASIVVALALRSRGLQPPPIRSLAVL